MTLAKKEKVVVYYLYRCNRCGQDRSEEEKNAKGKNWSQCECGGTYEVKELWSMEGEDS